MSPESSRALQELTEQVACRCDTLLDNATIRKIASSCQVDLEQVIGVHDMETVYQVPLLLQEQGLLQLLRKGLELDKLPLSTERVTKGDTLFELWKKIVNVPKDFPPVEIALVGKYTQHMDSYLSTVSFAAAGLTGFHQLTAAGQSAGARRHEVWPQAEPDQRRLGAP